MASEVSPPGSAPASHWERWHEAYENPASPLSARLATVQGMVRDAVDRMLAAGSGSGPGGVVRVVSLCAGQGRDVIEVLAGHPRAGEVSALLVEIDPALVANAEERAAAAGLGGIVRVVEGDASLCHWYAADVPADLVLVCGVFGNISRADITRTIQALPGWCRTGSEVIWTRHRRPPDATPSIRADFAAAGFEEVAFEAPEGYVFGVGRHRLVVSPPEAGGPGGFDPTVRLFDFVGDGELPA
jgi:hypothetical protein